VQYLELTSGTEEPDLQSCVVAVDALSSEGGVGAFRMSVAARLGSADPQGSLHAFPTTIIKRYAKFRRIRILA
jgi:hypothetical protein